MFENPLRMILEGFFMKYMLKYFFITIKRFIFVLLLTIKQTK